ncbi:hypothetical protein MMC26_006521 [Xylographa opegraphella]|nr:hypothetical protein [Xylographa opegraphella]
MDCISEEPLVPSDSLLHLDTGVSLIRASTQSRPHTKIWPIGAPDLVDANVVVNDPQLLKALCLDWDTAKSEAFIAKIPRYGFKALSEENMSPPKNTWALEEGTSELVERYLATKPPADIRDKRYTVRYIASLAWRKVIGPEESVVLVDYHTRDIFAVVLRDFIELPSVLSRFDKASAQHIAIGRNVRKGDPGHMAQYGYTAGARSAPNFAWARNLDRKYSYDFLASHNHEMMSAHTLVWNIATKKVPASVIAGFRAACADMPKGDWNTHGVLTEGRVSVDAFAAQHEISGLELGPSSGVCAGVYSRACHFEDAPADCPWVMSLTTNYDHLGLGGSFYAAKYGILIKQARNTLIVHRATEWHGTTVHDVDWFDRALVVRHRGFSLLVQNKLQSTWKKTRLGRVCEDDVGVEGDAEGLSTKEQQSVGSALHKLRPKSTKRQRVERVSKTK